MAAQAGLNVNLTLQAGNIQQIVASFQQLASQMQALGGQMNINVRQGRAGGGGGSAGGGGAQQPIDIFMRGLSRLIPGAGTAKAFKDLGLLGGMATGIVGILGFIKGVFDNSKVLSTFGNTFMRVFGHIVDIMLMPFIPLISKILQWTVAHGFPLARTLSSSIGKLLGMGEGDSDILGDIALGLGGIAGAFAIFKTLSGLGGLLEALTGGAIGAAVTGLGKIILPVAIGLIAAELVSAGGRKIGLNIDASLIEAGIVGGIMGGLAFKKFGMLPAIFTAVFGTAVASQLFPEDKSPQPSSWREELSYTVEDIKNDVFKSIGAGVGAGLLTGNPLVGAGVGAGTFTVIELTKSLKDMFKAGEKIWDFSWWRTHPSSYVDNSVNTLVNNFNTEISERQQLALQGDIEEHFRLISVGGVRGN